MACDSFESHLMRPPVWRDRLLPAGKYPHCHIERHTVHSRLVCCCRYCHLAKLDHRVEQIEEVAEGVGVAAFVHRLTWSAAVLLLPTFCSSLWLAVV